MISRSTSNLVLRHLKMCTRRWYASYGTISFHTQPQMRFFFLTPDPCFFFRSKKRRVEKVLQVSIALTSKQSNPSSLRGLLRHITHGARAALLNRTTHVCTCTKIKSIYFRPTRPDQAPAPCHSPISPIGKKESHAGHDRIGIILAISAGMRSRVWTLAAVADRRRDGRLLYLTYLT